MKLLFCILFLNSTFGFSIFESLPKGTHRHLVLEHCVMCHSEKLISQHRLDRQNWYRIYQKMRKEQGMSPVPQAKLSHLLDYLSTAFGVQDFVQNMGNRPVNPLPETIQP